MSNLLKIGFRADSSETIGSGHIMRCLVLAKELKSLNCHITFFSKDIQSNLVEKINSHDMELVFNENISDEQYANLDILIIDHYGINIKFYIKLKSKYPKLRIGCIDDFYKPNALDFVINQNLYACNKNYSKYKVNKKFIGPNFAMLRGEFHKKIIKANDSKMFSMLITCGGFDPDNLYEQILSSFETLHKNDLIPIDLKLIFIATRNKRSLNSFQEKVNNSDLKCELIIDTNEMATLMVNADCAFIAGGTTVLEVVKTKLPSLAIELADNQKNNIQFLKKHNLAISLGKKGNFTTEVLHDNLISLLLSYNEIKENLRGHKVGSGNLAKSITKMCKP